MADNKQKLRLRKEVKIVLAVLVGLVLAACIALAVSSNITKEEKIGVSITDKELDKTDVTKPSDEQNKVLTTVEIQLADTAVTAGTTFKVTAIVTPADTNQALIWSSGNDGVFVVDNDGIVTVKGVGTAVLTATVGNVSDAVVIEGIAAVTDGSVNKFPIYDVTMNVTKPGSAGGTVSGGNSASGGSGTVSGGNSASTGGNAGSGASGSISGGTGSSSGSGNISGGSTGNGSGNISSGGTASGGNSASGGGSTGGNASNGTSTGGNSGNGGSASGDTVSGGSTGNGAGTSSGKPSTDKGADSTEIGAQLPGMGFEHIVSNVYVCRDNGTYCGEIITQPNVTIMYIMQRSDMFDSKIKEVLQRLIPEEYMQVWNNYTSAASDRTFTVNDRMVRIVVAANGGHSQIVVYN